MSKQPCAQPMACFQSNLRRLGSLHKTGRSTQWGNTEHRSNEQGQECSLFPPQILPRTVFQKNIIENDFKWRSVSSYNLRYETMLRMPSAILEELSKVLAIPCDSETILSRLNLLEYNDSGPKNDRYHMTNLLHKNHITDGRQGSWRGSLDESVVREIEQTFRGWFQKNDYSLSIS